MHALVLEYSLMTPNSLQRIDRVISLDNAKDQEDQSLLLNMTTFPAFQTIPGNMREEHAERH